MVDRLKDSPPHRNESPADVDRIHTDGIPFTDMKSSVSTTLSPPSAVSPEHEWTTCCTTHENKEARPLDWFSLRVLLRGHQILSCCIVSCPYDDGPPAFAEMRYPGTPSAPDRQREHSGAPPRLHSVLSVCIYGLGGSPAGDASAGTQVTASRNQGLYSVAEHVESMIDPSVESPEKIKAREKLWLTK